MGEWGFTSLMIEEQKERANLQNEMEGAELQEKITERGAESQRKKPQTGNVRRRQRQENDHVENILRTKCQRLLNHRDHRDHGAKAAPWSRKIPRADAGDRRGQIRFRVKAAKTRGRELTARRGGCHSTNG